MSDDIVRYQRNFGDGRAFGNNPRFLKLPPIVQARIAACQTDALFLKFNQTN